MFELILRCTDTPNFEVLKWFDVDDKPFDKKLDQSAALGAIAKASAVLDIVAPQYSVAHGTALGIIRNGALIASDIDVDFTTRAPENIDAIIAGFENNGMPLIRHVTFNGETCGLSFVHERIKVDVSIQREEEGRLLEYTRWRDGALCYMHPRYETEPYEFNGIKTRMPSPPEDYLRREYGANWRTPVSYWHTGFCSENLWRIEGDDALLVRAARRILEVRAESKEKNGF